MHQYPIFISDLLSAAYTIVYFGIFFVRKYQGYITSDMYRRSYFPFFDYRFIIMGLMDATGQILGIYAARDISGYLITLLPQGIIPMTMITCIILLGTRYNLGQVIGASVLISGIAIMLIPDFIHRTSSGAWYWALIYFISSLPNAISFTLKEMVFAQYPGDKMDIFVVNSFDSIWQLVFTVGFLPFLGLGVVKFDDMGDYIHDGFKCLVGMPHHECDGMPWPTVIYISVNLTWNICILLLVKYGGAVLTFIALAVILPLSNLLFMVDWPLIHSEAFNKYNIGSLVVVLLGLFIYRYFSVSKKPQNNEALDLEVRKSLVESEDTAPPGTYFDPHSGNFREVTRETSINASSI